MPMELHQEFQWSDYPNLENLYRVCSKVPGFSEIHQPFLEFCQMYRTHRDAGLPLISPSKRHSLLFVSFSSFNLPAHYHRMHPSSSPKTIHNSTTQALPLHWGHSLPNPSPRSASFSKLQGSNYWDSEHCRQHFIHRIYVNFVNFWSFILCIIYGLCALGYVQHLWVGRMIT